MFHLIAILMGSMTLGLGHWVITLDASVKSKVENSAVQVMPTEGRISSEYGFRQRPCRGASHFHEGVDIANMRSTPIEASGAGRVIKVERERGYGLLIEIDHGHSWSTRYAHLSEADVKVGDVVGAGTPIGKMGESGTATGNHLHFELRHYSFAVNPEPYLSAVMPAYASNKQ